MIKTIMIEDQPIEVNTSQGWLFCYREEFGHDILPDLLPLLEAALGAISDIYDEDENADLLEKLNEDTVSRIVLSLSSLETLTVLNVLWAMAKNAGNNQKPFEFANSFEVFPYDTVVPELFWTIVKSSVSSKNLQSLINKIPTEKLPSTLIPSSLREQAGD